MKKGGSSKIGGGIPNLYLSKNFKKYFTMEKIKEYPLGEMMEYPGANQDRILDLWNGDRDKLFLWYGAFKLRDKLNELADRCGRDE